MENEVKTAQEVFNRMASLCSRSEQCTPEIRKKIIGAGISEDDADEIISNLQKEKFIDDERYVRSYTADKFRLNKWGRVKIRHYLKMKGLTDVIIGKGFEVIDENKYIEVLLKTMKEKARTVRKKEKYEQMGHIIRFAMNRGFEPELIHRHLGEVVK